MFHWWRKGKPGTYDAGAESFPGIQDPIVTKPVTMDVELPPEVRAVWIGASGSLAVEYWDGSQDTLPGCQAGTLLPIRPRRILSTSTIVAANLRIGL